MQFEKFQDGHHLEYQNETILAILKLHASQIWVLWKELSSLSAILDMRSNNVAF